MMTVVWKFSAFRLELVDFGVERWVELGELLALILALSGAAGLMVSPSQLYKASCGLR